MGIHSSYMEKLCGGGNTCYALTLGLNLNFGYAACPQSSRAVWFLKTLALK